MPATQTNDATPSGNAFPINGLPDTEPVVVDDGGTEDAGTDDGGEGTPSPEVRAAEDEASKHGWQDKEAWIDAGKDPDHWRPATEFLDIRTNVLKIARDENRALKAQVAALKARTDAK